MDNMADMLSRPPPVTRPDSCQPALHKGLDSCQPALHAGSDSSQPARQCCQLAFMAEYTSGIRHTPPGARNLMTEAGIARASLVSCLCTIALRVSGSWQPRKAVGETRDR